MSLLRWSRALLAALVLAGCKSESPPATPAQPPGPSAASAPAKAPAPQPAPAPAPAPVAAPATGIALSYLKPLDPERCEWVRQPLPSGEPTTIFTFNAACDRSMVSWSPDGKQGLVFTWPSGEGEEPKAWRVDLAARVGKPLELKTLPGGRGPGDQDQPFIQEIALDKQGRPVAIIADVYVSRKPQKGADGQESVTFEGKSYPLDKDEEGSPGLAHAYRFEEGGWKRIETQSSHFETHVSPDTRKLGAVKELGPLSKAAPIYMRMPGHEAPKEAVKKLEAAFPGLGESGEWKELPTPGGPVYYWSAQGGEYLYPSAPVAWEQGGKLVPLEGLLAKTDDSMDFHVQGDLLLVANYGDPRAAQVWDTRKKERVLSIEEANAPAFWPKPVSP